MMEPKKPTKAKKTAEVKYDMPKEVAAYIEYTDSMINYLKGEVARLKEENKQLKGFKKFAEQRFTKSSFE